MSWNPRRFVTTAKDWSLTVGNPHYVWLRADAVERVLSAVDNAEPDEPTVLYTEALPFESLVTGLESPIPTSHGDAYILGVPGAEAVGDNLLRSAIQHEGTDAVTRADVVSGMSQMPQAVERPVVLYTREGKHFAGGWVHMPSWESRPQTEADADAEMAELLDVSVTRSEVRPLVYGDEIRRLVAAVRTAWTLLNTHDEREATDTTLKENVVRGGSREPRDFPVQVVDIRRHSEPSTGGGSARRREPLEREYRSPVRGHWKQQAYGPGRALRRRIWVDEQVRGPEDKPLKPRVEIVRGDDVPD